MEQLTPTAVDSALRRLFSTYSAFGDVSSTASSLTSAKFFKLTRDAGLIDGTLSSVDVDLLFVRASQAASTKPAHQSARMSAMTRAGSSSGAKKTINYAQFLDAVYAMAVKRSGAGDPRPGAVEPNGDRGLVEILEDHLLPLARHHHGAPSSSGRATPTSHDGRSASGRSASQSQAGSVFSGSISGYLNYTDMEGVGERVLLANASLLDAIFKHYCGPVRSGGAGSRTGPFWDELRRANERLDPTAPSEGRGGGSEAGGSEAGGERVGRG